MSDKVKYNNYLNSLSFKNFTSIDFDLFMFLCAKMRNKELKTEVFTFSEIREGASLRHMTNEELGKALDRMTDRLIAMRAKIREGNVIEKFNLFSGFTIDLDNSKLSVTVNEKYRYILNEFQEGFTLFDLKEFVSLKSKFSKTLFRLLKQYRGTGEYRIGVEDVKRLFACRDGYETRRIMVDIINPSVAELNEKESFKDLACTPIKARGHGAPVTGYLFTFAPEKATASRMPKGATASSKPKAKATQHRGMERTYDYEELEKRLAML